LKIQKKMIERTILRDFFDSWFTIGTDLLIIANAIYVAVNTAYHSLHTTHYSQFLCFSFSCVLGLVFWILLLLDLYKGPIRRHSKHFNPHRFWIRFYCNLCCRSHSQNLCDGYLAIFSITLEQVHLFYLYKHIKHNVSVNFSISLYFTVDLIVFWLWCH
jgi:hypothetical protein